MNSKDKLMLEGLFEHSDFTIRNRNHHKFRRQVDMYLSNNYNQLNDKVIGSLFIRNNKDVALAFEAYPSGSMPIQMHYYIIGLLNGHNKKRSGSKPSTPKWAENHDVIGIFIEITERFKFSKTEAYELIAENLLPDNGSDKDGGGIDTIRQYIARNETKTRSIYN